MGAVVVLFPGGGVFQEDVIALGTEDVVSVAECFVEVEGSFGN